MSAGRSRWAQSRIVVAPSRRTSRWAVGRTATVWHARLTPDSNDNEILSSAEIRGVANHRMEISAAKKEERREKKRGCWVSRACGPRRLQAGLPVQEGQRAFAMTWPTEALLIGTRLRCDWPLDDCETERGTPSVAQLRRFWLVAGSQARFDATVTNCKTTGRGRK